MAESTLVRQCRQALQRRRAAGEPVHWLNVHGGFMQSAGEPDLSIVYYGVSVKAELKDAGKQPTRLQWKVMESWALAGAVCGPVWSVSDLDRLLDEAERRSRTGPLLGVLIGPA